MYKRQLGFTVIEVTLFLSLSGLLFLIVLMGSGAFVAQTRFSDGMHRIESYMQGQYDEVASGVNPRTSTVVCSGSNVTPGSSNPGASDTCILLGKVITFTGGSDTFTSYYVVGSDPAVPIPSGYTASQVINAYTPKLVAGSTSEDYQTAWGMQFTNGKRKSDGVAVSNVAFLRNPQSSQIITYVFNTTINNLGNVVMTGSNSGTEASFCFQSVDPGSKRSAIQILDGQGSSIISAKFDSVVSSLC